MESTLVTRQLKIQRWSKIIHDCQNSGLTIAKWCEQNNITPSNYYYWLKRVRQVACDSLEKSANESCTFAPIIESPLSCPETKMTSTSDSYSMRISVGNIKLEFSNGASESLIENALKVIHHAR